MTRYQVIDTKTGEVIYGTDKLRKNAAIQHRRRLWSYEDRQKGKMTKPRAKASQGEAWSPTGLVLGLLVLLVLVMATQPR